MTIGIFIIFIVAMHFVMDYPLQGEYIAMNKGKDSYLLFVHSWLWAAGQALPVWLFGTDALIVTLLFAVNAILHQTVDKRKCDAKINIWQDQLIHFVQISMSVTAAIMCQRLSSVA